MSTHLKLNKDADSFLEGLGIPRDVVEKYLDGDNPEHIKLFVEFALLVEQEDGGSLAEAAFHVIDNMTDAITPLEMFTLGYVIGLFKERVKNEMKKVDNLVKFKP